jgi:hypothetical protein
MIHPSPDAAWAVALAREAAAARFAPTAGLAAPEPSDAPTQAGRPRPEDGSGRIARPEHHAVR